MRVNGTLEERFNARVERTDGCWLWRGYITPAGYGGLKHGPHQLAHRISYMLYVGPIPDGLQIDHLCRVRHCVNPEHLEPVTARVNLLRGVGWAARNAAKTHCPKGHPYSGKNLRVSHGGGRMCVTCAREATRKAQARRKELGLPYTRGEYVPHPRVKATHCKHGHPFDAENTYVTKNGLRQCRTCGRERHAAAAALPKVAA